MHPESARLTFRDMSPDDLDDLALLCPFHHDLIPYRGWQLTGPPGHWTWRPPPGGEPPGPFDDDGLHLKEPPPGTVPICPIPAADNTPPDLCSIGLFDP